MFNEKKLKKLKKLIRAKGALWKLNELEKKG